jgi:hypothetical protein
MAINECAIGVIHHAERNAYGDVSNVINTPSPIVTAEIIRGSDVMSSITRAEVVEYATASAMQDPINVAMMAEMTAYRTLTKSDDAVLRDHTCDQPVAERYATAINGAITAAADTNPTMLMTTQWEVRDGEAACE